MSSIIVTMEKQAFPPAQCFYVSHFPLFCVKTLGPETDVKNKIKNVKRYFLLPCFLKYLYYPKRILVFFMGPARIWGERLKWSKYICQAVIKNHKYLLKNKAQK